MSHQTKYIMALAVCGLALTSCELTGDPRSGGIFWSPSKAQARQDALRNTYMSLQGQATAAEQQNASLKAKRNALKNQIAAKKAQLKATTNQAEAAMLESQIKNMENQLAGFAM